AMIAITALLATVEPNVGPTDVDEKLAPEFAIPICDWIALRIFGTCVGCNCFDEIWKPNWPSDLSPLTFCTVASLIPCDCMILRTCDSLVALLRPTLTRVPEVKSIPRCRPRPPIASAPISRITPDMEKKYLDAPMKSN